MGRRKAKLGRRKEARLSVRPFALFVRFAVQWLSDEEKGGGGGKNAIEALRIRTNSWKHLLGDCEGAALYSQLVSFLRIMAERAILLLLRRRRRRRIKWKNEEKFFFFSFSAAVCNGRAIQVPATPR